MTANDNAAAMPLDNAALDNAAFELGLRHFANTFVNN